MPRAPHAGPLLRHVYEQEHGRGGFAGKVSHTYHLYPPTNWLPAREPAPGRSGRRAGSRRCGRIGGLHHVLGVAPAEPARDVYRGMARLVANATAAMNVTAPRAPMDYFFEHHGATMVFFVHEGRGTLETTFGPIEYRKGDFLIVPKGVTHRFELGAGPHYYWMYESFAGDPEKSEAPDHRAVHHPQPQRLPLPALARHAQRERAASRSSPRSTRSTRAGCTPRTRST